MVVKVDRLLPTKLHLHVTHVISVYVYIKVIVKFNRSSVNEAANTNICEAKHYVSSK